MRYFISNIIVTVTLVLPLSSQATLEDNALYQWQSNNGTPTYSPEPPPEGVEYIVVGADLKPLAIQPAPPSAKADNSSATPQIMAAPAPKWKPVRYANDPTVRPLKTRPDVTSIAAAGSSTPLVVESDECLALKRDKLILESQFARAKTSEDMDKTILQLHTKSGEYNQRCKRS